MNNEKLFFHYTKRLLSRKDLSSRQKLILITLELLNLENLRKDTQTLMLLTSLSFDEVYEAMSTLDVQTQIGTLVQNILHDIEEGRVQ